MRDVLLASGVEVVHAQDVVPVLEKPLAEVAADEAGPTRHQDPFSHRTRSFSVR
jgi:hypothetical protein